jgi:rhodanese-related sulfurtransferase
MSPADLSAAIESPRPPAILDVRTAREFAGGHVPGAINIPFREVAARTRELAAWRDDPLVVYCGHGPRAWIAARALRRAGFTGVDYLRGHMAAWRRAGLAEKSGSDA